MFPLKNYKYQLPLNTEPGSFGYIRKHDIHTGVDLYCENNDAVYAMYDGIIVNIENFTGVDSNPPTPWWYDTKSILILHNDDFVICYGEIEIQQNLRIGDIVREGDIIGYVKQVLKKDKGITPLSMLHIEMYEKHITESVVWNLNSDKPGGLLDISTKLYNVKNN